MPTEKFKLLAAVHLLLFRNNSILLLRRFNTGYEDGNYSVPAGHIEDIETATQATIREALEETGIMLKPSDLKMVHVMHRKGTDIRVDFFFIATNWLGEPMNREPNKCNELAWFSLNNLPTNIIPYVSSALQNYQAGVHYSEFDW